MNTAFCPCGSKREATGCCESIISGKREAATAEELMRSRYVAFTKANVDYLMRSHHSATRKLKDRRSIEQWAKSVKWMGLTILNTSDGLEHDTHGIVEFRALYIENGSLLQIHEKSFFDREVDNNLNNRNQFGRWVYTSGIHL